MVVRTIYRIEEALMSVATELVPAVWIPERARPPMPTEAPRRLATVTVLVPPGESFRPTPVRLTRRGVVVLTLAVLALGAGLIWLAKASAPAPAASRSAPGSVTVRSGDTLWSIASRVAPQRDPRAEVASLQQANHLSGVDLVPGQLLRVP
jgi:nucleoid-associated protein YgaU